VIQLIAILSGFSVPLGAPGPSHDGPRTEQPSVVLVIADDAGWIDFGFNGGTEIATPEMDRLAAEGVTFGACYVTGSVCSPSRAGLLTGRHQQRFGHEYNLPGTAPRAEGGLPLDEVTIADRLDDAGLATGLVGKWHLGLADRFHPTRRGFDEFHGLRAGSRSYFGDDRLAKGDRRYEHVTIDDSSVRPEADIEYLTDTMTDDAVDFIRRHADRPSFLVVAYTAPHGPMHARPEDLDAIDGRLQGKRRTYAAMMRALDRGVGRIADAIDETGRDTMLIFVNDNGGATNNASDNGPWRGMKGSLFEGGIRVPAFLRRTETTPPGSIDHPTTSLDLVATAIAATGADGAGLDGIDLSPWIGASSPAPDRSICWRRGPVAAIRDGGMKLIRVEEAGSMLFDVDADPGETTNLAPRHPAEVVRLLAGLAAWEHGLVEPRWTTGDYWRKNLLKKHRMDVRGREAERALP
jgi:arylsulfatase A-like enzyme